MQASGATLTTYAYDASGTRVTKSEGGNTTRVLQPLLRAERGGRGHEIRFAGGQLVAKRDPVPAAVPATSLTFLWAIAACGGVAGPHDVNFAVNNQPIFQPPALWALPLGGCPGNCTTQIRQVTINNPAILSLVNNPAANATTYSLMVTSTTAMIAWAKVAINVPNQAPRELVIFDYQGGGDAAANNTVICGTARGPQAVQGPGSWSVVDPKVSNDLTYYHPDHMGSTRVRTDANGSMIGQPNSYLAYGEATPGQRFGYALSESDDGDRPSEYGSPLPVARNRTHDFGRRRAL